MGISVEEKIFRKKLRAFGIYYPKIMERPSGVLIAYPQPGEAEKWKASFYQDEKEQYHFEIEFGK
jgi:hypothetical protein